MGDQSTRDMFQHVLNIIEGTDSSEAAIHTPLCVSAYFPQLTHYDQTIKTGNGFLYSHDGVNYLVTTAHLLFDTNKSVDTEKASKIVSDINGRKTLTNYCYSRFFDVAVFDLTTLDIGSSAGFDQTKHATGKPDNANVKYMDPNTGNHVLADAKYLNLANASVEMGAVCHKLIQGASGAAVTNDIGKLVGMVSSCGEQYDNMTLCVPISVIHKIVSSGLCAEGGQNYDSVETNTIYPHVVTVPLQMGHLLSLPNSITQGECVVQSSDIANIKPFDIITKVGSVAVGRENKVATQALLNNSFSINMKVIKLNDSWRDIYGALPRSISYYNGKTPYNGEPLEDAGGTPNDSTTDDYIHNQIIVSQEFGQININGNTITVGDSEHDEELISATGSQVLYNNILHPGCLVKFINTNQDKTVFASVTSINTPSDTSITTITIDKTLDSDITDMIIFPFSSIYTENCNDNALGVFDIVSGFSASEYIEPGTDTRFGQNSRYAKLTNMGYKDNCINFVIKYWATLVCSNLMKLPMGQQHIVWASEIKRLFNILPPEYLYNNKFTLVMAIFYKLLEFNDVSVMNLLNILLQNIIQHLQNEGISGDELLNKMQLFVIEIKDFFPIIDNTNSLSNSINIFGKKITYAPVLGEPLLNYEGTIVTDENGGKLFEIIEITREEDVESGELVPTNEIKVRPFQNLSSGMRFKVDIVNEEEMVSHLYTIDGGDPETILLTDNINGDSTFNAEGYSAEHYHQKNTIAKATPRQLPSDNVNQNLELCYKELEYLCNNATWTDFGDDELYYPRFFGLLQYFWDKAHITLGGIMTTLDSNAFDAETNVDLTKSVLPAHLGTWNFDRLLGRSNEGNCSDENIKTNIKKLGQVDGINVYSFNYIFEPTITRVGVMAQELLKSNKKNIVYKEFDGIYRVNYRRLNLLFNGKKLPYVL